MKAIMQAHVIAVDFNDSFYLCEKKVIIESLFLIIFIDDDLNCNY